MKDKRKQDEGSFEPAETQEPTVSGPELKTSEDYARWAWEHNALDHETTRLIAAVSRLESEVITMRERFAPRPISTCPKDGTWFLAWYPHEDGSRGHGRWAFVQHDGKDFDGCCCLHYDDPAPTHWLPMPGPIVTEGRE